MDVFDESRYTSDSITKIPFATLELASKSLQRLREENKLPAGTPIWTHELIKGSKVIVPSVAERIEVRKRRGMETVKGG